MAAQRQFLSSQPPGPSAIIRSASHAKYGIAGTLPAATAIPSCSFPSPAASIPARTISSAASLPAYSFLSAASSGSMASSAGSACTTARSYMDPSAQHSSPATSPGHGTNISASRQCAVVPYSRARGSDEPSFTECPCLECTFWPSFNCAEWWAYHSG